MDNISNNDVRRMQSEAYDNAELEKGAAECSHHAQQTYCNEEPATKCAVPTLRERIRNQRYRSESEAKNAGLLAELEYLLDKNPEVARILELLDRIRA